MKKVRSSGFVFDVNNNRVLTMDMNSVQSGASDIFVPKSNAEPAQNKKSVEPADIYTPTAKDYGIEVKPNGGLGYSSNGNVQSNSNGGDNGNGKAENTGKEDLTTDVNAFVNLVVRGDEKPVLEFVKKIKDKGVSASEFAANVVLELDTAYRAKLDGETNHCNIVLSQIVSHWGSEKMEATMSNLLGIAENHYADKNLGTKIAMMRIMRS